MMNITETKHHVYNAKIMQHIRSTKVTNATTEDVTMSNSL